MKQFDLFLVAAVTKDESSNDNQAQRTADEWVLSDDERVLPSAGKSLSFPPDSNHGRKNASAMASLSIPVLCSSVRSETLDSLTAVNVGLCTSELSQQLSTAASQSMEHNSTATVISSPGNNQGPNVNIFFRYCPTIFLSQRLSCA